MCSVILNNHLVNFPCGRVCSVFPVVLRWQHIVSYKINLDVLKKLGFEETNFVKILELSSKIDRVNMNRSGVSK